MTKTMSNPRWLRPLRRLLVVVVGVAAGALLAHLHLTRLLLGGSPLLDKLAGLIAGVVIALATLAGHHLGASGKE